MTESIKQPYVGVSGVVSPEIEKSLEAIAEEVGLTDTNRALALGVKAVHKTLYLGVENKYGPDWYPVGGEAFNTSLRHDNLNSQTIGVAQAYLDVDYVDNREYRDEFLKRIVDHGRPWLQAVQFDMMPWHANPDMWDFLATVKDQNVQVFLQAHKTAMETLGPQGIAEELNQHSELVDYVLFDSSHGTGTRLDVSALQPFIAEAHEKLDLSQTGVAIAGGLTGAIIREDLPELIDTYPNISWDAEGQLHTIIHDSKRPLDLVKSRDYLEASSAILSRIK